MRSSRNPPVSAVSNLSSHVLCFLYSIQGDIRTPDERVSQETKIKSLDQGWEKRGTKKATRDQRKIGWIRFDESKDGWSTQSLEWERELQTTLYSFDGGRSNQARLNWKYRSNRRSIRERIYPIQDKTEEDSWTIYTRGHLIKPIWVWRLDLTTGPRQNGWTILILPAESSTKAMSSTEVFSVSAQIAVFMVY